MNLTLLKSNIPEIVLIGISILYLSQTYWSNPYGLVLLILIAFQLVMQYKTMGIIVGSVFSFLALYMTLALVSELLEFESWVLGTTRMIIVGSLMMGTTMLFGILLVRKNVKRGRSLQLDNL